MRRRRRGTILDYCHGELLEAESAAEAEQSMGVSLSMGHGLDRSDPSTHVERSEILTRPY